MPTMALLKYLQDRFVIGLAKMPEGEKNWGCKNLPSPLIGIGLTDLPKMGGRSVPPPPLGSDLTA
jgi:hypothetical protein